MSDVFLSYASADRLKARTLAGLFESAGWSVWWDRDIDGGEEWSKAIESELAAARVVVVLWSRNSVNSEWVVREAKVARERNAILPVLLEPVVPPGDFAELHATTLTAWLGEERSFELRPFLERLAKKLGGTPPKVDEFPVAQAAHHVSRIEVAEAAFEFCVVRLEFYRLRNIGVPEEVLEKMRATYDRLCEVLAPASSDDVHGLISRYESAFTPTGV